MRAINTSCLPRSVKGNLKLSSFFATLSFMGLLLISMSGVAQITDPFTQCTNGCTSNDVQIQRAYLVEPNSPYNELGASFQCQGSANVKLALDLTTKTPRVGVYVFARIVNHANHATIYATVGECFSKPLASGGTTKVVFNQAVSWPCGTQIDLIDVFIGWGTGNTDFCAGSSDPRCPATPSKCFSLPPGQYITIQIPSASNSSMTQCETTVGGGTSSFDLTTLNGTVSNNASGVTVNWWETYSGGVLSNNIPSPGAYISGSKNVYAKVKNNADTTAYSVSTVALSVVGRPTVYTLSGNSICASAPGTGVITLSGSQTGVSYQLKKTSDNSNVGSAISGTGSALQWASLPASTNYYVVATGATPTSCTSQTGNASVTSVSNPTAYTLTGNSICASAPNTGVLTLSNSQTGVSYQLKKASDNSSVGSPLSGTGSSLQWTSIPANVNYYVVATGGTPTSCTSQTSNGSVSETANPGAPSVTYNAPACDEATFSITVTGLLQNDVVTVLDKNGAAIATLNPASPYTVPASTTNRTFVGIPAGSGYRVTLTRGGCTSTAQSCGASSGGVTQKQTPVQNNMIATTEQPTVNAYPNPFNDRVKFVVNAPAAGNGSLEVYNIMGQRVKTVYQGHINTGDQSFELTIPKKQQATLIYIFRVGDKKVTGKLLQLNN